MSDREPVGVFSPGEAFWLNFQEAYDCGTEDEEDEVDLEQLPELSVEEKKALAAVRIEDILRGSSVVERVAYNPQVAGPNPAPANGCRVAGA